MRSAPLCLLSVGSLLVRPYEVVFTRSARRALERGLPENVATAAFEFIMGPCETIRTELANRCASRLRRCMPLGGVTTG